MIIKGFHIFGFNLMVLNHSKESNADAYTTCEKTFVI
tara:strand:+ start:3103 stop:3213 length:111 start_codon:yes stop_codon:yes gene_type:complete